MEPTVVVREYIATIFQTFSKVIEFEDENGKKINIYDIKYLASKNNFKSAIVTEHTGLNYTPYHYIRFTEPVIIMIKEILLIILQKFYFLDKNKKRIIITGFRLKLKFWTRKTTSLFEGLRVLSSKCNCSCIYCYRKNSPLDDHNYMMSLDEANTRIKYYNALEKKGLFDYYVSTGEFFLNKYAIRILEKARKKDPVSPIQITTNGTFLTKKIIKRLESLKPIHLNISLNSTCVNLRKQIMGGGCHENVVKGISLVRAYEISYIGSILMWPEISFNDVRKSLDFLQKMEALYVVLFLPGFNKYNKPTSYSLSYMKTHWCKIRTFFCKIRNNYDMPIILDINSYWISSISPVIDGIIKNSPAYNIGLKSGDVILAINDKKIFSRNGFIREMMKIQKNGKKVCNLFVRRGSEKKFFSLREFGDKKYAYPYKPKGYSTTLGSFWGVLMCNSIYIPALRKLKQLILSKEFSRIVVFVSPLMKKQLNKLREFINLEIFFNNCDVKFITTKNYFWGGNIILGDLMMVEDFCRLLNTSFVEEFKPEAVVIPRTFVAGWGRDFSGVPYTEIERKTGYRVFLLPCTRIEF